MTISVKEAKIVGGISATIAVCLCIVSLITAMDNAWSFSGYKNGKGAKIYVTIGVIGIITCVSQFLSSLLLFYTTESHIKPKRTLFFCISQIIHAIIFTILVSIELVNKNLKPSWLIPAIFTTAVSINTTFIVITLIILGVQLTTRRGYENQ